MRTMRTDKGKYKKISQMTEAEKKKKCALYSRKNESSVVLQ